MAGCSCGRGCRVAWTRWSCCRTRWQAGVAFVPGAAFYADGADDPEAQRTLRLSFVTASVDEIDRGIAALAAVIRQAGS